MAKKEKEPVDNTPRIIGPIVKVATPSGACPVKLEGTSKEEVIKWIEGVCAEGRKQCLLYQASALVYWVRVFYTMFSPKYHEVCAIVLEYFGENNEFHTPNYEPKKYEPRKFEDKPAKKPAPAKPTAGVNSFEIGDDEVVEDDEIKVN